MNTSEIQQKIRTYIVTSYLPGEQGENLRNDEDLLLVLNSLQLLRMVMEMESMFGVSIDNDDMTPENLGTVEKMATFIHGKSS